MKCLGCGHVLSPGAETCPECNAARAPIEPAFALGEKIYAQLREEYDSGALPADEFKSSVEAQRLEHDGAYWMLGVNSGQWYVHDGADWRERDPPLAASVAERGRREASASPPTTVSAATPRARGVGRSRGVSVVVVILALVVALVLAAAAIAVVVRVWSHDDRIVQTLLKAPLPGTFYSAADLEKPELSQRDRDWDPGQNAKVVFFQRAGRGAYTFDVFRTDQAARSSYERTVNSDRAEAAQAGVQVVDVYDIPNIRGICMRGNGRANVCRALAGRTVMTLIFAPAGAPEEAANQSAATLVNYTLSIDR